MVDPPQSVTVSEALDRLATLVEIVGVGGERSSITRALVETAASAAGSADAGFVEFTLGPSTPVSVDLGNASSELPIPAPFVPGTRDEVAPPFAVVGRVVASCGALEAMLGRPVTLPSEVIAGWVNHAGVAELDSGDPEGQSFRALVGAARCSIVRAAASVGAVPLGALLIRRRVDAAPLDDGQRSAIRLCAAYAGAVRATGGFVPARAPIRSPRARHAESDDGNLFIAVTSHGLRTPLTAIRGYADTLADHWDNLDEMAKRSAVSVIRQRARHLGRLLDRLLTAAGDGPEAASSVIGAPFDVAAALGDAVEDLPADLRRHLRLNVPSRLPNALGDRGTIAMIVTELVTNASKYSANRFEVDVTAGAEPRVIWLRVADRGIGIRPEHAELAFERFWQYHDDDHHGGGGVGLGLYLVRRIVERQRGWVSLRQREGGGTVVEVRLPRGDTGPGEA